MSLFSSLAITSEVIQHYVIIGLIVYGLLGILVNAVLIYGCSKRLIIPVVVWIVAGAVDFVVFVALAVTMAVLRTFPTWTVVLTGVGLALKAYFINCVASYCRRMTKLHADYA